MTEAEQVTVQAGQEPSKESTEQRRYLEDPNYYRILYSLAAHQVNGALSSRKEASNKPRPAPEQILEQGRLDAEKLLKTANEKVRAFVEEMEKPRRRRPWSRKRSDPDPKHLSPRDRRLYVFLSDTVGPCAELLYAGASTLLGRTDAEEHAEPVRERAHKGRTLPYRPLYNLACYEVTRANYTRQELLDKIQSDVHKAKHLELALEALEIAFSRVHGRPRRELARWARQDPALAPLNADAQAGSRFRDLLDLYGPDENDDETSTKKPDTTRGDRARTRQPPDSGQRKS